MDSGLALDNCSFFLHFSFVEWGCVSMPVPPFHLKRVTCLVLCWREPCLWVKLLRHLSLF